MTTAIKFNSNSSHTITSTAPFTFTDYLLEQLPDFYNEKIIGTEQYRFLKFLNVTEDIFDTVYSKIKDFYSDLNLNSAHPRYLYHLSQLLGLTELKDLTYSNDISEIEEQRAYIKDTIHRLLIKGTPESLIRLFYGLSLSIQLEDLWTSDFSTFYSTLDRFEKDFKLSSDYSGIYEDDAQYYQGYIYADDYKLVSEIDTSLGSSSGITNFTRIELNDYNYMFAVTDMGLFFRDSSENWSLLSSTASDFILQDKKVIIKDNNNLKIYNYDLMAEGTISFSSSGCSHIDTVYIKEIPYLFIDTGTQYQLRDFQTYTLFSSVSKLTYLSEILSDEFNAATQQDLKSGGDGAKSFDWNILNSTNADSADSNITNSGKLTINNTTGSTDLDGAFFQGPFAYKNITGNFDIETIVSSNKSVDIEGAGLIVRDPAASGGEDWFGIISQYITGAGANNTQLLLRNVTNSSTDNTGTVNGAADSYFKITRTGNIFTVYSKVLETDTWTQRQQYTRNDFASTVQVGFACMTGNTTGNLIAQFDYFHDTISYGNISKIINKKDLDWTTWDITNKKFHFITVNDNKTLSYPSSAVHSYSAPVSGINLSKIYKDGDDSSVIFFTTSGGKLSRTTIQFTGYTPEIMHLTSNLTLIAKDIILLDDQVAFCLGTSGLGVYYYKPNTIEREIIFGDSSTYTYKNFILSNYLSLGKTGNISKYQDNQNKIYISKYNPTLSDYRVNKFYGVFNYGGKLFKTHYFNIILDVSLDSSLPSKYKYLKEVVETVSPIHTKLNSLTLSLDSLGTEYYSLDDSFTMAASGDYALDCDGLLEINIAGDTVSWWCSGGQLLDGVNTIPI